MTSCVRISRGGSETIVSSWLWIDGIWEPGVAIETLIDTEGSGDEGRGMSRGDLWRKYQYKQPLEEAGKHTGRSVNERGTVKDRPVDNNEGSVGSSSP